MDEELEPERRLWGAVVLQAFADATSNIPKHRRGNEVQIRATARRWLISDRWDFYKVCEMAGISPDDVREFARKLKSDGWRRSRQFRK